MSETTLGLARFEKYSRLLAAAVPELIAAGLCDASGRVLACSDTWATSPEGLSLDLSRFVDAGKTPSGKCLSIDPASESTTLFRVELDLGLREPGGSLVALLEQGADAFTGDIKEEIADALDAASLCVEKECQLTAELDAMAKELAGRYEELNLVYETRDDITQYGNESEALNQLVLNCVDYLDVGMATLLFEGQNRTFCVANKREPIHEAATLAQKFYGQLYPWVHETGQSLVINDLADPQRNSLCSDIPYKVLACPVLDGAGNPVAVLVCANHLHRTDFFNSDRKLLEAMARKASKIIGANFDSLTGLVKARGFEKAVEELLQSVRKQGVPHCMLHVDLDQLQVLNDTLGREAGDAVITQTAKVLRNSVRTTDVVGYLGQGKYGVLLEKCPVDRAIDVAEHLRDVIGSAEFVWGDRSAHITVTTGMASIESDTSSIETVLEAAELACDMGKETGRNRTQLYRQDDGGLIARKQQMQMVNQIHTALREGRFRIYCQTIQPVQPDSDRYHFEVLVRLLDEVGEVISPSAFIPAAERYHLMPIIDRWVIKNTCEILSQHAMARAADEGTVSINLSGQSFADEDLITYISEQMYLNGVHPSCLCFEVTETAAMSNTDAAHRIIQQLRAKGCRFSLDDFGTGMSSFAYLKTLPVDYLKIDGSFVRQIIEDRVSRTMVAAVNEIGHVMELKTIAEFVENEEIARRLAAMKIDYLQGYYIAKPIPIEEYIALLGVERRADVG